MIEFDFVLVSKAKRGGCFAQPPLAELDTKIRQLIWDYKSFIARLHSLCREPPN